MWSITLIASAFAYSIEFSELTIEDGLSSTNFQSGYRLIMQDKDGFLWFGTASGLNRYDGYQFKTFTPEINKPNTISGSYITALWQGKDGIIWVGTLQGLNQYNTETNQFTPFFLENSSEIKDNNLPIKSMAGDGNGIL